MAGVAVAAGARYVESLLNGRPAPVAPVEYTQPAPAVQLRRASVKKPIVEDEEDFGDVPRPLQRLGKKFNVPSSKLIQIVRHMISEMKKGLVDDNQALKMIPTHVIRRPNGNEVGSYLALDLGGSNFRVCEVILEGNGITRMRQKKYSVREELKTGDADPLFDFFAECVAAFIAETENEYTKGSQRKLGFTFSFPVHQISINRGYLLHWTKGFHVNGVEGKDVVKMLQEAFHRKNVTVDVTALVNDTTGTLISHAYQSPNTYIGVILGTGSNAAYVEQITNITKLKNPESFPSTEMLINIEWGAFDNEGVVLPITEYDVAIDRVSLNPRQQIFEKLISGMYLGEIVRLALLDLVETGEIFSGKVSEVLKTRYSFETAYMSRIERDHTLDLSDTKAVLEDLVQIPRTSHQDRKIVRGICELVGRRAARLAAAGIAAIATKINRLDGCTVAVDGSLFELYPHFANRMRDALREILGLSAENILLEQARDGSGQGAALIAALAEI
ncbi:hexokinase-domain-containing protein [Zopfochytrium polystomum]|nr:hexokinase-domain-containing protein [Zopfochytrium polystomum]